MPVTSNGMSSTCGAVAARVAASTVTRVRVFQVVTRRSVTTRTGRALVDV